MEIHTAEGEGISSLPAPILHRILSFLSQAEAVRTCVLSKSWRHLGSTRPKFSLKERYVGEVKEKFLYVLDKSLQVYYDQKLSIELFRVRMSMADPELVSLLENWIPKVIHDMGVKKFVLRFNSSKPEDFDLPSAVFESKSLQELYLQRCNLSKIDSIGNYHLKELILQFVYIKEETFAKIMSSCSLIESLSLLCCKGFKTINMHNHHNLKSFELSNRDDSIESYLPSTIGCISIYRNPNWFRHRNYFPGLTCLRLAKVPLSNEWFNSFSRNFPCLEELGLWNCNGFDEFKLSSRSIKNLYIRMDEYTTNKATIDAPSMKVFHYNANISQSISFSTTSSDWNSQIHLLLNLDSLLWFVKLSELVAEFSQSQISLGLYHSGRENRH